MSLQDATRNVVVTIRSTDNPTLRAGSSTLTWSVDPYHLVIDVGDTVIWQVDWEGCSSPHIVIHPKGAWPFFGAPHEGTDSATASSMKANPQGHYEYGIVVTCPGGGAVVIDPDMDVE